jgi:hypothetical protein
VDDEQVKGEQPGQEHRMMFAHRNRVLIAFDEIIDGERSARRGYRLEANSRGAVCGAVND